MNRLIADAQTLARARNFAAAAELCRRAIAEGDNSTFARQLLAAILHDLGVSLWLDGREAEAEYEFRAAIVAEPRHIDALNNLAAILQLSKRHDDALGLYRQALAVDPANVRVLENLAKLEQ